MEYHTAGPLRAASCALALSTLFLLGDAAITPTRVSAEKASPAGQSTQAGTLVTTPAAATDPVWLGVEKILQQPELPNGCEVTSLSMLLAYYGFNVTKTDLADYYLPTQARYNDGNIDWGGDPEEVYPGNPRDESGGWYCYAKPLAGTANRYLAAMGGGYTARDITGINVEALEDYLRGGTPVAVWITTDGTAPRFSETAAWRLESGKWFRPYVNVHCVVLTGCTESSFLFADPLDTLAGMDRSSFEKLYTQLGSRAMVLEETA